MKRQRHCQLRQLRASITPVIEGKNGPILNYGHTPQLRGGRNLIMSNYVNLGGFGYVNHVFNYGALPEVNVCQLRSITGSAVIDAHVNYGPHTLYKCVAVIEGWSREQEGRGERCR